MRSITCRNPVTNAEVTFGDGSRAGSQFVILSASGLYSAEHGVEIENYTMMDGGSYQGSTMPPRNIVITAVDTLSGRQNRAARDALYALFRKDSEGMLTYSEDGGEREIAYIAEGITPDGGDPRRFQVSLLCPSPMFRDTADTHRTMADYIPQFEFPHQFTAAGEELSSRSAAKIVEIVNGSSSALGMTATVRCTGDVKNPSLILVETGERLKAGRDDLPLEMGAGDVLTVTTGKNDKHVRLASGGVTAEVNQYITEDSEYIQIPSGTSHIAYRADEGEEHMVVDIYYRFEYEGA